MFSGSGLSEGVRGDVRGAKEGADGGSRLKVGAGSGGSGLKAGADGGSRLKVGAGSGDVRGAAEGADSVNVRDAAEGAAEGADSGDVRGVAEGADSGDVRGAAESALRRRLSAEMQRSYFMGVELAECMTETANLARSVSFQRWQTEHFRESLLEARAALRQKEIVIRGLKAEKRLRKDLAKKEFVRGFWKAVRLVHRRIGMDLSRITEDDVSDDGELLRFTG